MLARVLVAVVALVATAAAQPRKPKPPPAPAPVDPRLLPVWSGNVEGGAVQVHAADADAEALRAALAPKAQWVALPVDKRVTGRIAVKKRAAALDALVALAPALKAPVRRPLGGGPKVDLDFRAASTTDLYRLLADVLRTNIVVLAPESQVTVRVKKVPAGVVLREIVRVSGAELERPAKNLMVVRPASASRIGFIPSSGVKISLDAHAIHAGLLLALIRAIDPTAARAPPPDGTTVCSGGRAVTLRLTKVALQTAMSVAVVAGGADLRGPRCPLPALPLDIDPRAVHLRAVVERGGQRMAAVEVDGKGYFLLDGRDVRWRIGSNWIELHDASGSVGLHLDDRGPADPGHDPFADIGPATLRLAATVMDGREHLAIVEVDGVSQLWTQGRAVRLDGELVQVVIAPARVMLRDGRELRLTPRPPDPL